MKTLADKISKSEVLKLVAEYKKASSKKSTLFANNVRALKTKEVKVLEKNNNLCADWRKVLIAPGFIPEKINYSSFTGFCVLGNCSIFRSDIINSEISDNAVIVNSTYIKNALVGKDSRIINTQISADEWAFCFGLELCTGPETGERTIKTYPELGFEDAEQLFRGTEDEKYSNLLEKSKTQISFDKTIVQNNAKIKNTNIISSFIGPFTEIDSAVKIENTVVLSSEDDKSYIRDGALVKNSIVQWGSGIDSMAIVENSFISDVCHVERHAKVSESYIGPNTGIAEGEVTSCFLGPFIGFHHQSLLISADWSSGKGNVGYGANVGSNHTSRLPDQEIVCGEGLFFGLGVNIKFPADYSNAPYSIIATGLTTLPQRVEFPFSLIMESSENLEGISPAINRIIPAWVLSDNVYMLCRNQEKYKTRNKSKRSEIEFEVFRKDIMEMVFSAWNKLQSISETKEFYTEGDISGLGKNYLLEKDRIKALEFYKLFMDFYIIKEIYNNNENSDIKEFAQKISFNIESLKDPKSEYKQKLEKLYKMAELSRDKDFIRYMKILKKEAPSKINEDKLLCKLKEEINSL